MTARRRRNRSRRRRVTASVVAATVALSVVVFLGLRGPPPVVTPTCTFGNSSTDGPYVITPIQAQNAALIAAVGLRLGLPDHAATVALATSMQESRLQNLPYGDRDSLGLFQQRPSQGWGSSAQVMNPIYAATAFFDHLAQIPGWESMPVTEAAQLVQRSADPTAYARWGLEAQALAEATTGEIHAGLTCHFGGFGGAAPSPKALSGAASAELGPNPFAAPASAKQGWQVAVWAVAHAYSYHLTSVSYGGRKWTGLSGAWVPAPVVDRVVTSTR
ncbi:MAG: hypothetical protein ACYCV7_07275 [Acidimicrobiales bacterium]